MQELVIGTVFICLIAIVFYVTVRATVGMYRNKNYTGTVTSGFAGAMGEVDRIVRPSVECVVEAKEAADKERGGVDGE